MPTCAQGERRASVIARTARAQSGRVDKMRHTFTRLAHDFRCAVARLSPRRHATCGSLSLRRCVLLRDVCWSELCVAARCVLLRAVCCCELCLVTRIVAACVVAARLRVATRVLSLRESRCRDANEARPRTSGRWHNDRWRGVAQPGSALALGARCREFESPHPDQIARPALCVAGWRFGKRHAYARAGAVGARMDLHRAAEAIHRLLHDGKTEAGTVARRSGHAVEAL
jgi:hypothetical protein